MQHPPNRFRTVPSAGKRLATVSWDTEGITLVDWLESGTTRDSIAHEMTLRRLCTHNLVEGARKMGVRYSVAA